MFSASFGAFSLVKYGRTFILQKTPKNTLFTSPDPRSHYKNDTVGAGARQTGPCGGEGGRAPGLHHPQPPVQLPLSHRGHGRHPVQVSGGDYRDPSIVIVLQGQDPQWAI